MSCFHWMNGVSRRSWGRAQYRHIDEHGQDGISYRLDKFSGMWLGALGFKCKTLDGVRSKTRYEELYVGIRQQ